jgi:hypothetical protein
MQTARTASDVDQMVWRLSSNAPFARDAKELKNSMPLGLMGLLDDDQEAEALFGGSETNAVLREVATKGRDERGPVAPALGTRHLERLLQEERDKVAVLEARVAELETQLAAERVAAAAPSRRLKDPPLCMVCREDPPRHALRCGHVSLCASCIVHVCRCPVCDECSPVNRIETNL